MTLLLRAGTWHVSRRVPRRYRSVEPRGYFCMSLKTDSRAEAERKAADAWTSALASWEAALDGDTTRAAQHYIHARKIAQKRGFRFLPVDEVARLPLDELLARVEAAHDRLGRPKTVEAPAVLGTIRKPRITVEKALTQFFQLAADQTRGKSADQIRRWENPRKKAVANFVSVIGNKNLDEITGDDMLDFRDWWLERLESEDLTANSANKDLTHLAGMWRLVNQQKRLGLVLPLDGLSIKEDEAARRPPFSREWIKDKLLAPGALGGLNSEARAIVLGMVNTGYRPSEGAALTAEQIRLDANVPHISIEPIGRQLKSKNARRRIPLLGASLDAFRPFREGFPRYRASPATLSATVNKFMRDNGLMETDKHVLYSLRHSFETRMIRAGIDDRIRRELFGHALGRQRYGEIDLAHAAELLAPVAL